MTDSIRLPDLIPAYAAHYRVSSQEAAYMLHGLMTRLRTEFRFFTFPDDAVWVRNLSGPDLPGSRFRPYADGLVEYFKSRMGAGDAVEEVSAGAPFSAPLEEGPVSVPASMVCFSRERFGGLVRGASTELFRSCDFLHSDESEGLSVAELSGFTHKELVTIQNLCRGLIEIIVEVDRAHRGESRRADPAGILRAAAALNLDAAPTRWREALAELARVAELDDFRGSRNTLKKYVGDF